MNLPLFEHFPYTPGYKGAAETGRIASQLIRSRASAHRQQIEAWFRKGHQGSGEAVGKALGIPKTSARSRCSELAGQGILVDSGARDCNTASGKLALVWRLKEGI